jgi:hypothetical protein
MGYTISCVLGCLLFAAACVLVPPGRASVCVLREPVFGTLTCVDLLLPTWRQEAGSLAFAAVPLASNCRPRGPSFPNNCPEGLRGLISGRMSCSPSQGFDS